MKFLLSLIICSGVAKCLPPFKWPEDLMAQYDCLMSGYAESVAKIEEIGPEKSTKNLVYKILLYTDRRSFDIINLT